MSQIDEEILASRPASPTAGANLDAGTGGAIFAARLDFVATHMATRWNFWRFKHRGSLDPKPASVLTLACGQRNG